MSPLEGREATKKTTLTDSELGDIIDLFMEDQAPVTVVNRDHAAVGQITIKDALTALRQ